MTSRENREAIPMTRDPRVEMESRKKLIAIGS
jgi:hypothetical protein